MSRLLQDIRYALRMLAKSPGFTAIAVLTLALGIGANTSIFSVVYAALLRSLPYSQPSRLITLSEVRDSGDKYWDSAYPDYLDWQRQSKAFSSLAGFTGDGFVLHGAGEPSLLAGAEATTNFFSTLGVKPILGHDFAPGDDVISSGNATPGPKVALLTYNFWRTQFGGDPRVIGRTLQLDSSSVAIIGVLPREFEFAPQGNAQIWVPLHLGSDMAGRRSLRWMPVIGRLASGVTPAQARVEMNAIDARLGAAYPQENSSIQIVMIPLRDKIIGQVQPLLLILFGAVGFVLLIACANVANLLMVRAAGRRREFAIRVALGASRGRLVSQMLTESLMLSLAGGALGFLAAQWGTRVLVSAIPKQLLDSMPFLRDTQPNAAILAFLCGIAVLTGVVFGLAPAWQVSHERVSDALKEETNTSAGGVRTRLRDALVITEIAFSLVLLVSAGLMVKSLGALLRRNPGFDTQNLLTFAVNLPDASYPKDPDAIRFDKAFTDRLRGAPGIVGIGNTSIVPLTGGGNTVRFLIEGQPMPAGHEYESDIRDVSAEYFSTMKIPLIAGRFFNDAADSPTAPKHAIVNQAWVKQYLHGQDPIGKRFRFTLSATQPYREIVGVVGNIADADLDSPEAPALFLPFTQDTNSYISYIVRTAGNPVIALGEVRDALHQTDPQLFPIQPLTMEQIIGQAPSVFLRRYPSYLIGSFSLLALLLAVVGLYGLISYSVSQRTREMGIRIALGAQQGDLLRLVLGQGFRLAVIGVAVGVAAGLGLTQFLRALLYGVQAADPLTFVLVAIALLGVALAACYIPARRAMRTDPMVALRYE
jgi:putative ABC transport system permease protein